MAPNALVIFAKWPVPGQVKTRLCPPLQPDQAAELARCFLIDTVERVCSLKDVQVWLAFTPSDTEPLFRELLPSCVRYLPQRGKDLGERELNIFIDLLGKEAATVAIMGSDIPSVPLASLQTAFAFLKNPGCDAVFGPSSDGGYYFVGAKAVHASLFGDIEWSTEKVLQQTLGQACLHNLHVSLIPAWFDVDTTEDLQQLAKQLAQLRDDEYASRTRAFLKRLAFL
jgi:rSAM/selenodomain-associated transferase 1